VDLVGRVLGVNRGRRFLESHRQGGAPAVPQGAVHARVIAQEVVMQRRVQLVGVEPPAQRAQAARDSSPSHVLRVAEHPQQSIVDLLSQWFRHLVSRGGYDASQSL